MDILPFYVKGDEPDQEGWIFSILDCQCSRDEIAMALADGKIGETYHDLLIANLHDGTMKEQSFQPV